MWIFFSFFNAFFESLKDVFSKLTLQRADEYTVAGGYNIIAGILLLVTAIVFGLPRLTQGFWTALFVSGSINVIAVVLYINALRIADLSLTVPLLAFTPVFLLITSPLLIHESPAPLGFLGVVCVVVGSYILNVRAYKEGILAPLRTLARNKGSRMMFAVAFLWSISSNIDKVGIQHSSPIMWAGALHLFIGAAFVPYLLSRIRRGNVWILRKSLFAIGFIKAISTGLQMVAMSMTLVPYAISVKRMSAIMGVLWGVVSLKKKEYVNVYWEPSLW